MLHRKNILGVLITFCLVSASFLYVPLFAAGQSAESTPLPVPQPSQAFYYFDESNLLSEGTRSAILEKNTQLNQNYGVQLVVMAVNTLPGSGYSQRVDYLREVLSSWQVGGSEGRGLILALSVSDEDYLAVAGQGLQELFTTQALKSLLDTYLEPDFSARAYDAGAAKFFSAAAAQVEEYAAAHPEFASWEQSAGSPQVQSSSRKRDSSSSLLIWVASAAGAVAVICIAIYLFIGHSARNRRTVHRRVSLITPPRSNVLRHESRPTVQIKSSRQNTGVYRNQKHTSSTRSRGGGDWRQ